MIISGKSVINPACGVHCCFPEKMAFPLDGERFGSARAGGGGSWVRGIGYREAPRRGDPGLFVARDLSSRLELLRETGGEARVEWFRGGSGRDPGLRRQATQKS
jgi:hypothetical protein